MVNHRRNWGRPGKTRSEWVPDQRHRRAEWHQLYLLQEPLFTTQTLLQMRNQCRKRGADTVAYRETTRRYAFWRGWGGSHANYRMQCIKGGEPTPPKIHVACREEPTDILFRESPSGWPGRLVGKKQGATYRMQDPPKGKAHPFNTPFTTLLSPVLLNQKLELFSTNDKSQKEREWSGESVQHWVLPNRPLVTMLNTTAPKDFAVTSHR